MKDSPADIMDAEPEALPSLTPTKKKNRRRRINIAVTSQEKHFTRSKSHDKRVGQSQLPEQFSTPKPTVNHDLFHLRNPKYIRWLHELDNFRELMNCLCNIKEKTGIIVQCECCLTWQHVACLGVESDKDLPEVYVCYMCKNPKGVRESCRYIYDFSWLKNGIFPTFPGSEDDEDDMKNIKTLRRNKILIVNLLLDAALEVSNVIHALHYKLKLLEKRDADLSLWKDSWLSKEPTTPPLTAQQEKSEQELSIHCNDFVPLKSTGINDIFDFSKDILETAPMEQDKNDVPDDLKNELQEGTDLITFITSSYDDLNGVRGNGKSLNIEPFGSNPNQHLAINPTVPNLDDSNPLFSDDFVAHQPDEGPKKDSLNGTLQDKQQNLPIACKEENDPFPFVNDPPQPLDENFVPQPLDSRLPQLEIKDESESSQLDESDQHDPSSNPTSMPLDLPILKEEKPDDLIDSDQTILPELAKLDSNTSDQDPLKEMSKNFSQMDENFQDIDSNTGSRTNSQTSFVDRPKGFDCDEIQSQHANNLREHLMDLQDRLSKRLEFLNDKIGELEMDYGLHSDPEHVREDAAAFSDLIKELYKDLDLVQKISQCAS